MSKNILIVDDQPKNLQIISDYLKESDNFCKIMKAPNGKIALKLVEKKTPDLIITDWEMPVMDGIEFIKQLRKNIITVNIPVIMCTGVMLTSKNLQTALKAGASDFIRKPIDKIELTARTNSMLQLGASQQKLLEQNKTLSVLNATKDKFFSIISHDLKSSFYAILGFSDILLEKHKKYDDEERENMINLVNISANSAFKLLENLLTWSGSQSGAIKYLPEKLGIKTLLFETLSNLQVLANKKNIQILDAILENELIFADKNMIATVFRNLISNAIKFTSNGGSIIISSKKQIDSDFIEISVKDNGVGVPKGIIGELFRIDKNTSTQGTENETGTGLGLILCKEFIEKHGGKIWVESKESEGSTFHFTIPK